MKRTFFVFILFLIKYSISYPQSIGGYTGLLLIPTAEMPEDGEVSLGFSYIDEKYIDSKGEHVFASYARIGFLPFLEIGLRVNTWIHPEKGFYYEGHIGDRMPSLRLLVQRENRRLPSIVFGMQDISAYRKTSEASNFHSTYCVASKRIKRKVSIHLGYGEDIINANGYQFIGIFGGVSYSLNRKLALIGEYDAEAFNIGFKLKFFKYLQIAAALRNFSTVSGGISCVTLLK